MAANPANPNLDEDPNNTPDTYAAHDVTDSRFFILGIVRKIGTERVLSFIVVTELAGGVRGAVRGKEFFDAMMTHVGHSVDCIEAEWSYFDPNMTTNLDVFNTATLAGDTLEVAATKTPTGKYSVRHGYKRIDVDRAIPPGAIGNFSEVRVLFRR